MFCLVLLAAILAEAAGCGMDGDKPHTLLFILAGQSNMSGRGALDQLPPDFPANRGRIKNFTNADVWAEAKEPLDDPRGQKDACSLDLVPGVGPGASFAQRLTELLPAVYVGLIPCARGRVTMDEWAPNTRPNTLYGSSLRRARLAEDKGRMSGVLFYQGESDAYSRGAVEAWPRRFAALVASWRRDLGDPKLPVVFCQVGNLAANWRTAPAFRYWDLLKNKQAGVSLPGVRMVTTDDLPLKADGIHLTTAAQIYLGRRLAQAMYELLLERGAAGVATSNP